MQGRRECKRGVRLLQGVVGLTASFHHHHQLKGVQGETPHLPQAACLSIRPTFGVLTWCEGKGGRADCGDGRRARRVVAEAAKTAGGVTGRGHAVDPQLDAVWAADGDAQELGGDGCEKQVGAAVAQLHAHGVKQAQIAAGRPSNACRFRHGSCRLRAGRPIRQ